MATGYVLLTFVLFVPALAYAGQPVGIGAGDVLKVVGRQMVGAVAAAGMGFLLRFTVFADVQGPARTFLLAASYLAVYLIIVAGLLRVRTPLQLALSLMVDFLPARFAPLGQLSCLRGPRAL